MFCSTATPPAGCEELKDVRMARVASFCICNLALIGDWVALWSGKKSDKSAEEVTRSQAVNIHIGSIGFIVGLFGRHSLGNYFLEFGGFAAFHFYTMRAWLRQLRKPI